VATPVKRLRDAHPNARMVHLPVHASWLNQVEIYFSVIQRKVLTPNDFPDLDDVVARLIDFERRYEQTAKPFEERTRAILSWRRRPVWHSIPRRGKLHWGPNIRTDGALINKCPVPTRVADFTCGQEPRTLLET
jgi:hypothetical protein